MTQSIDLKPMPDKITIYRANLYDGALMCFVEPLNDDYDKAEYIRIDPPIEQQAVLDVLELVTNGGQQIGDCKRILFFPDQLATIKSCLEGVLNDKI